MEMEALDKIDRLILRTLQADGRATYDQLAEQVSLSPSAVLRRVKRLEESRVIDRYVALVQPEAIGLKRAQDLPIYLVKCIHRRIFALFLRLTSIQSPTTPKS